MKNRKRIFKKITNWLYSNGTPNAGELVQYSGEKNADGWFIFSMSEHNKKCLENLQNIKKNSAHDISIENIEISYKVAQAT